MKRLITQFCRWWLRDQPPVFIVKDTCKTEKFCGTVRYLEGYGIKREDLERKVMWDMAVSLRPYIKWEDRRGTSCPGGPEGRVFSGTLTVVKGDK